MALSVSVVIPTWNAGARYRELLAALERQDKSAFASYELVVIDSGSSDGTREASEQAGARVTVIPQKEFNHGGTRNRGIGLARGEVVVLLTQDAVPSGPKFLESITRPFEAEGVDGVYARQFPRPDCDPLLAERLRRWSASRDEPSVSCFARGDADEAKRVFASLPPMQRYLACVFDNVASAVRRSTWKRHPFPESNFGEDVAWARRVLLAGGAIAFEPSAEVEHSHRIDVWREFKRIYRDHKNLYELFELRTQPTWRLVFHGWGHQRRFYKELLAGQDLPERERLRWRLYSIPYALFENAAQFLGARSHWKARSGFWRWADRKICAD